MKLTMIELFSGIGAQIRGFKNSGLFDTEVIATSEIDKDAIVSYAAIHCGLTPELIEEGFVREIISKVQTLRKEADFEVTDHITLYIVSGDKISEIVTKNADKIKSSVLADYIKLGSMAGFTKELDINGEEATFGVAK